MDELAAAAGVDPIQYRLNHLDLGASIFRLASPAEHGGAFEQTLYE